MKDIRTAHALPPAAVTAALDLSRRELQVLCLLLDGLGRRAAGERLGLSEETVKMYCRTLYAKLDVHSRHGLASAVLKRLAPGRDFWSLLSPTKGA